MIKRIEKMVESYEEQGRNIDYINRVLASFAEIYNYDYTKSALLENGSLWNGTKPMIRKDGMMGRIRAYFDNQLKEDEKVMKMFYNETTLNEMQKEEYGFLTLGELDSSIMADMIAMAVRIIEAFGIHHVTVNIKVDEEQKEDLFRYLDCLDIEYREKDFAFPDFDKIAFEIKKEMENGQTISLIQGGSLNKKTKEISGLETNCFAFKGDINDLLVTALTIGNLKREEKMLDIVVTYETELEKEHALYLVQELRLNGFKTEMSKKTNQEQLKEQYHAKYGIILKEADIVTDQLALVDLDTQELEKVKEMDLINHLDINF